MAKGLKTLIAGILLVVVGLFVMPVGLILYGVFSDSAAEKFLSPVVAKNVEAKKEGKYYLWNEYQTMFGGQSYNKQENLPDGLTISLRKTTGEKLEFFSDHSLSVYSSGGSKKSVGYIKAEEPMDVLVTITGSDEARVFSFGRSTFASILKGIGLVIAMNLLGALLIIVGIVRLAQSSGKSKADSVIIERG